MAFETIGLIMLNFQNWLAKLHEIKLEDLDTKYGRSLDDAETLAMYLVYHQAYSAEGLNPWKFDDWYYSRGRNWTFVGVMPRQADIQQIRQILEKNGGDKQRAANEILSGPDKNMMSYVGGISYRDAGSGTGVKITSSFGMNSVAKMRAAAEVIRMANESVPPKNIFTAADSRLKDLIVSAEEKMPKYFAKKIVAVPSLGLVTPPKSLVGLFAGMIDQIPGSAGHGRWTGFNPQTGALKMNLQGVGEVEKFIFGNKAMWSSVIKRALEREGHLDKVMAAKKVIDGGGMLGWGAKKALLLALNTALAVFLKGNTIDEEGMMWLLDKLS